MKKLSLQAFTLIETLVAVAILAVLLSGVSIASRTLIINSRTTSEQQAMQNVAQDIFANMRLIRNAANAHSQHFYDALSLPALPGPDAAVGVPYMSDVSTGTLAWCPFAGNNTCKATKAWVVVQGATTIDGVRQALSDATMVAVARAVSTNPQSSLDTLQLVDAASAVVGNPASINADTSSTRWTYYTTKVSIQRYAAGSSGISFASDEGRAPSAAVQDALRGGIYKITVVVTNYNDPQSTYTASEILTDTP